MSLFLILLAAGESKRLKSTVPKPFLKVNGKSLLEISYNSFASINRIKKTVVVYNKKHKKYLSKLYLGNAIKVDSCLVFPPVILSEFPRYNFDRYFLCFLL